MTVSQITFVICDFITMQIKEKATDQSSVFLESSVLAFRPGLPLSPQVPLVEGYPSCEGYHSTRCLHWGPEKIHQYV